MDILERSLGVLSVGREVNRVNDGDDWQENYSYKGGYQGYGEDDSPPEQAEKRADDFHFFPQRKCSIARPSGLVALKNDLKRRVFFVTSIAPSGRDSTALLAALNKCMKDRTINRGHRDLSRPVARTSTQSPPILADGVSVPAHPPGSLTLFRGAAYEGRRSLA
jgi:hypothetical protein